MPNRNTPLYRSAKISDDKFREVLRHFVRDHTAAETARQTGLSHNSTNAIFHKLRVYFTRVGLFVDIYERQDLDKLGIDNPVFERDLLSFHFSRVGKKRGIQSPSDYPVDYHFAESYWRFGFDMMTKQRPSELVYSMMEKNLLEIIEICGSVGSIPENREAGLEAVFQQIDRYLLWLKRNAPNFSSPESRETIDDVLDVHLVKKRKLNRKIRKGSKAKNDTVHTASNAVQVVQKNRRRRRQKSKNA